MSFSAFLDVARDELGQVGAVIAHYAFTDFAKAGAFAKRTPVAQRADFNSEDRGSFMVIHEVTGLERSNERLSEGIR